MNIRLKSKDFGYTMTLTKFGWEVGMVSYGGLTKWHFNRGCVYEATK